VNPSRPLTVNAGVARTVSVGSAVTLTGSAADPNVPTLGAIASVWSTTTTGVTLTQGGTAAAPTVTFTAPATSQTLTFTLTSTNAAGTFTSTVLVTVSAVTLPPAGSLVAAYGFNEAAGVTTVTDASGNNNTGTISAATRVASQASHGSALSFNGTTSIVNVPDTASLRLTAGMTLEAWVNPAALSATVASTILLKQDPITGLSYALYANDPPKPSSYIRVGSATPVVNGAANLPLNSWSHLAATYDGTTYSLYVNGVLVGSHAQTGVIGTSFVQLMIGGNTVFNTGEHFKGLLDDIRIYKVALSAAQIQADMTTPVP
jgi:concanavalin A-like lectin/glucanase superfamily protein